MPRVIAQMVARNEVDRFLPDVLEHLSKLVDLIVFTDDASDDGTPLIAKGFGCETFESPWDESQFKINEGALRQYAWHNLEKFAQQGDWILAIDADEKLYGRNPLSEVIKTNMDVLGIVFYHMWNETHFRVDKAWRPSVSSRLFRYYPNGMFKQRKLACGSEPTYVQELIRMQKVDWNTGLHMQHLGYVKDEDKKAKHERYMLLDGGDFHSRAHIESIMDPKPILFPWEG